jgi:hypothetical protein
MKYSREITLGKQPIKIWGYGKRDNYVGRLEITAAGLAAYTGVKGGKRVANLTWEGIFEKLRPKQRRKKGSERKEGVRS